MNDNFIFEEIATILDTFYKETKPGGHDAIITALKKFIAAFGGCTKCWGKGYSTQYFGTVAAPDFEGDKPYQDPAKPRIIACKCERGRALEHLLDDLHKIDI